MTLYTHSKFEQNRTWIDDVKIAKACLESAIKQYDEVPKGGNYHYVFSEITHAEFILKHLYDKTICAACGEIAIHRKDGYASCGKIKCYIAIHGDEE